MGCSSLRFAVFRTRVARFMVNLLTSQTRIGLTPVFSMRDTFDPQLEVTMKKRKLKLKL